MRYLPQYLFFEEFANAIGYMPSPYGQLIALLGRGRPAWRKLFSRKK